MLPRALTIAGSDSSGGAGIQADLKTFTVFRVYGMSAVTALTAQNTRGVTGIFPVTPEFVRAQIDAVVEDIGVDAAKTGMLANDAIIARRGRRRARAPHRAAGRRSGDGGAERRAPARRRLRVRALRERLIPLAALVTPNVPEAEALLDAPVDVGGATCAKRRAGWSSSARAPCLVKGGHLERRRSRRRPLRRQQSARAARPAHRHAPHARHRLHAARPPSPPAWRAAHALARRRAAKRSASSAPPIAAGLRARRRQRSGQPAGVAGRARSNAVTTSDVRSALRSGDLGW